MNLKQFEKSGRQRTIYRGSVKDLAGDSSYELSIAGEPRLVEKAFADSEFELEIDAKVKSDEFEKRSRAFMERHLSKVTLVPPEPGDMGSLLGKKAPAVSAAKDTIAVYLRRTEGEGTFWAMWFPALRFPPGGIFFILPRVWTTWGMVAPISGDPDIFLRLGPPPGSPIVSAGRGLGVDTAWFLGAPLPWTHFAAWYSVVPFTRTAVGGVMVTGHSIALF